jgi:hypothetical protein
MGHLLDPYISFPPAAGGYAAVGVEFESANADAVSYGDVGGSLADSKLFTLSAWINVNAWTASNARIFNINLASGNTRFAVFATTTTGQLRILGRNAAGTVILDVLLDSVSATAWHHLLISCDMASGISVYLDDADAAADLTTTTFTDAAIDFTADSGMDCWVGAFFEGSDYWDGFMADLWVDLGNAIDITVEANRRKFIDAAGKPVDLGATGQLPTGSQPEFCHSGAVATWHTNKGSVTGGTETGELSEAPSSPSD